MYIVCRIINKTEQEIEIKKVITHLNNQQIFKK